MTIEGNHDHSMGKYYSCHFNPSNLSSLGQTKNNNVNNGDGDYWFIYGNVLFMILDGNAPNDIAAHDEFMKQAVSANPNVKWEIAAWHQSAYSVAGGSVIQLCSSGKIGLNLWINMELMWCFRAMTIVIQERIKCLKTY